MKLSRQPVQSTKLRSTQRAPGSAPSFASPKQRSNLHPPFFVKGTGLPISLPAETAQPCRDSLLEVAEHQHPREGGVRVPRLRRLLMQRLTPESQGGGRCEQKQLLLEDRFPDALFLLISIKLSILLSSGPRDPKNNFFFFF